MLDRLRASADVRPGEERLVLLLGGFAILTSVGGSFGGNGIDALFFAHYGVEALPRMYVALAACTIVTTLVMGTLISRGGRERLYVWVCPILATALVAERAALELGGSWVYPVLWLSMQVFGTVQGLATWGLAGALCDTRQARRLFPLVSAGLVLGGVAGGAATPPLARLLHTENLSLLWSCALLGAFAVGLVLLRRVGRAGVPAHRVSILDDLGSGFVAVRRSPLLIWLALSAGLFSLLSFALTFPFAAEATRAYPSADALAGFLGLFQAAATGLAFLVSALFAGRLYREIGLPGSVLALPALYVAGFGTLVLAPSFAAVAGFRFVQMAYLFGVSSSAYHALFNVIPSTRRDQARAFIDGAATQAGTAAAGLLLLLGQRALPEERMFMIGLTVSVLATLSAWQVRRSYGRALASALLEGRPIVFGGPTAAWGAAHDVQVASLVRRSLESPEVAQRRAAAELAGMLGGRLGDELIGLIRDPDPGVRAAAARALAISPTTVLGAAGALGELLVDREPAVQAAAAAGLGRLGEAGPARETLARLAASGSIGERAEAQRGLALWGIGCPQEQVVVGLADAAPIVRRAAAQAAAACRLEPPEPLFPLLGGLDPSVREASASACAGLIESGRLVELLGDPGLEEGALRALELRAPGSPAPTVSRPLTAHLEQAWRWHGLARLASSSGPEPCASFLAEALLGRARRAALLAIRLAALGNGGEALGAAAGSLTARDPGQRANAIEALETCPVAEVRRLGSLFEAPLAALDAEAGWLDELRRDASPVVAAMACLLNDADHSQAGASERPDSVSGAHPPGTDWPGGSPGEEATGTVNNPGVTLDLVERALLLRNARLFAALDPEELGRLAAVTDEVVFQHGEMLVREGDAGAEMYVIIAGEVRVLAHGKEVARRLPGDAVGEMALLTSDPRSATLIAHGEVRTLTLSAAVLESAVRERPELGMALIRELARYVRAQR